MGSYNPNMIQIPLESFTYKNQSDVINEPEATRCSKWNKESQNFEYTKYIDKECTTMFEAFRHGAAKSKGGICLGWRNSQAHPYQWLTYNEVLLRAENFGCGLLSMGLSPGVHSMVGIYSRNCPEWVVAEQGMYCYSMVTVPLYDSLGPDARAFVITECEMRIIVAFDEVNVKNILDSAPPCLKVIVTVRDVKPRMVEEADSLGIKIVRFHEVEKFGSNNKVDKMLPQPETIATICFSRLAAFGNTLLGKPKGVMLSHENFIAATSACILQLGNYAPNSSDTLFSFLPLAHTLERCCELSVYMAGGAVGFYSGNMKSIAADMKALKPTILPAVPRFLNRIYDSCVATANKTNWFRHIFNFALKYKTDELDKGIIRKDSIWDTLVFWFVRKKVGGNVRLMIVGSAPLAGNVLTFMRAAMGCIILEGYGQTECVAPCTLTTPGDPQPDHVGPPLPCNNIKLEDVPDMEYLSSHGQGEVCIMGANVFRGYYRDPERTSYVLDADGWLHTGDIGEWLPNGTLKIIDRKKQIFKLSNGEYVAPEHVEKIYTSSRYIAQVFVHGDSLKSCVIAVIVPRQTALQEWAERRHIPSHSFTALCNNREVKRFIMEDIVKMSQEAELAYYEEVKEIYLHPNLFSMQNGLLSASGKLMRQKLVKYFKPQLEDMYKHLD
eukprot:GFUD01013279.1.p1 GENE.GFUD01013279.1~~GFUD01013279.1.p1  ORF type:complete len:666 (+),score=116.54 GFUD01013279.1:120-2117(+)